MVSHLFVFFLAYYYFYIGLYISCNDQSYEFYILVFMCCEAIKNGLVVYIFHKLYIYFIFNYSLNFLNNPSIILHLGFPENMVLSANSGALVCMFVFSASLPNLTC